MRHLAIAAAIAAAVAAPLLVGCPPSQPPNVPPDADAAPDPTPPAIADGAPTTVEQRACVDLAAAGCAAGSQPQCPATIAANKLPQGGYATPWAACLYGGGSVASCHVPCR